MREIKITNKIIELNNFELIQFCKKESYVEFILFYLSGSDWHLLELSGHLSYHPNGIYDGRGSVSLDESSNKRYNSWYKEVLKQRNLNEDWDYERFHFSTHGNPQDRVVIIKQGVSNKILFTKLEVDIQRRVEKLLKTVGILRKQQRSIIDRYTLGEVTKPNTWFYYKDWSIINTNELYEKSDCTETKNYFTFWEAQKGDVTIRANDKSELMKLLNEKQV